MVLNTKLRLILTTLLLSLFVVGNAITVYYKDTNGWGGVNGHVWNASASSENTGFPGKQWIMKCVDGSDTWYKYEYQSTSMNLKLSKYGDPGTATGDIGPLTTDCWIEGTSSTPYTDPTTLAYLESLTFTSSVAIKFASDALTGWNYSNALSTTTSDNENYSLTYLYSTGSEIDVFYDTNMEYHVPIGEMIGYSASYIGQVVTFTWNVYNRTLSVKGFIIVPDVPAPHYLGRTINLTAENGTGPTYTWYESTDDGATYSEILGETTETITVLVGTKTRYKCVDDATSYATYYDVKAATISFASGALAGWNTYLPTTTSDNENYSLTYLYETGSGIDVWYDTTKKKNVSTGEIIGYSASYIGQVVTFTWNITSETLSVTGFSIVPDIPTPHYLGDIINLPNGTVQRATIEVVKF
ncbi:MAG: hypothetical protein KBA02_07900 [Paludibacteraceae bacterium]|nr:hypothetical protein [Paludibacteraceae bacterium]